MTRRRRVLVFGAGVVGQIYGGRLAAVGHDVTLLARGDNVELLGTEGVKLERSDGDHCTTRPRVLPAVRSDDYYDVVLVTVRRDQLHDALPHLAELATDRVVFLLNNPLDLNMLRGMLGAGRTVFGFPGVGGYRAPGGAIRYLEIRQQRTTIGRVGGIERPVVELLGNMVAAVGDGFRALARSGVTVTPAGLRIIFTRAPRSFASRYWRRQLRGALGTIAIAPHVSASAKTELPVLWSDVRRLIEASEEPVPELRRALDAVQGALP